MVPSTPSTSCLNTSLRMPPSLPSAPSPEAQFSSRSIGTCGWQKRTTAISHYEHGVLYVVFVPSPPSSSDPATNRHPEPLSSNQSTHPLSPLRQTTRERTHIRQVETIHRLMCTEKIKLSPRIPVPDTPIPLQPNKMWKPPPFPLTRWDAVTKVRVTVPTL